MPTLVAQQIELAFGDRRVLRGCDLVIDAGEAVGLVGANGSGKSTLMRVLSGQLRADHGQVVLKGRVACLDQEPALEGATVAACAEAAIAWHTELLDSYQVALDDEDFDRVGAIQARLDQVGWHAQHRVDAMLDRLGAPPADARTERLSGGERRRVALALALLGQPDLLLLDEPTNHLDADAVEWLQGWLGRFTGALLLVTHDRYLLEAVAGRIVEIDNGECIPYEGSYGDYLVARAERQASLKKAQDRRLALIAREAEWAARSPAARSTKQRARLDRLDALKQVEGRSFETGFELDLRTGVRKSSVQVQLIGMKKAFGGRELLGGLDLALVPGERLGVLGPNGAGKSTLLHLLAGTLQPDKGEIVRASRLAVAVLDQHRTGLDAPDGSDWSVYEAAGGGNAHVDLAGREKAGWQRGGGGRAEKTVSVEGFLSRFLFGREMLDQRVSGLSGGERARLLLARLLLQGASVLLLDEPTNDLDLLTLRILEEALLAYDGTALIVTHDRAFLDRVCTGVLAFEAPLPGEGPRPPVTRYASRQQYLCELERRRAASRQWEQAQEARARVVAARPEPAAPRKLSWKEQREFEALPDRIESLEAEQLALAQLLGDPQTWKNPTPDLPDKQARAAAIPGEIEALFERWSELEARAAP